MKISIRSVQPFCCRMCGLGTIRLSIDKFFKRIRIYVHVFVLLSLGLAGLISFSLSLSNKRCSVLDILTLDSLPSWLMYIRIRKLDVWYTGPDLSGSTKISIALKIDAKLTCDFYKKASTMYIHSITSMLVSILWRTSKNNHSFWWFRTGARRPLCHAFTISLNYIIADDPRHQRTLMEVWPKVKGVYQDIQSIRAIVAATRKHWIQNSIPFSVLSTDDATDINFERLEPSFMYTELFKDVLLTMNYGEQSREPF